MIEVLNARPIVKINGVDYYAKFAADLISFSYTDNLDKADDLQLELKDESLFWVRNNFPGKGDATLEAGILVRPAGIMLDCGTFQIDQPSYSGPPNRVSLAANSIPVSATIKGENKTRGWEGKTLQGIANDIAAESSMTVLWDTKENPIFKRVDQNDQADLDFLESQIKESGLMMKVKRSELKIFSEKEYEEKAPSFVLRYGAPNIISWSFSTKTAGTAKESEVEFTDPETGKVTKAKAVDSDSKLKNARKTRSNVSPKQEPDLLADPRAGGLMVARGAWLRAEVPPLIDYDYQQNQPDKNKGKGAGLQGKATKKAQADLREANRHRDTAQFEVVGNPLSAAGQTVQLIDWGYWDGKYFLEQVQHKLMTYRCTYSLHRELASHGY